MTPNPASTPAGSHRWRFFRTGGLDQVRLDTAADLLHLGELDQKLWVALSCPTHGLEFDERTLALIDTDGDGRIGVPEVLAAVQWAGARLNDAADLLKGADALPLAAINAATPEGKTLLASAKQILASIGKKDAPALAVGEATDTAKVFAANPLNGDGVIPPEASEDPAVQGLIKEIIDCVGGTTRRSGTVGVNAEQIDAFFAALTAYAAWTEQSALKDIAVLGEATDAACAALKAVRPKVEDFFARTRLAAFDERAIAALNRSENDYLTIAAKDLTITADEVRDFPLARVEADRALPLFEGVNPAWAGALAALHAKVVAPLLGADRTSLTAAEWAALNARFAPYETWLGGKAGSAVEKLGIARVKAILAGHLRPALATLVAADKALEPEFKAISDVERLARYHRDLRTLLHNFVNFADFYSRDPCAMFQAGTLFLDSRSTDLCLRVAGANPLAAMSKAYIAYCACTRAGDGATMTIAACFTQGDSDYLFVGRNGVFYDRQGRLWYAVITSIAENPISIRQAFWSPYKKFLRMIEEQVAKRAAAADAEASGKLATAAEKAANADKAKPEPKKFDLALITGIGVALGSIGTFLAAVFAKFLDLPGWQLPLILIALMLLISLPSMVIAGLKLRQRTLGPILESNGWAINGRVKINIPFGTMLTSVAKLPPNAERSLTDPYADKSGRRIRAWLWILVIVAVLTAGVRYYLLHRLW
ncbi:MAG TPA: hypothetical protein VLW52_14325 [Opitutaceae bacterium]|nr:hypothetical protein [Opitutaceae bacterium]